MALRDEQGGRVPARDLVWHSSGTWKGWGRWWNPHGNDNLKCGAGNCGVAARLILSTEGRSLDSTTSARPSTPHD